MNWKHYDPSIWMFHLYVAAFAMNFDEAKPFQTRENLPAGEDWEFHTDNLTSS
jgi:hypothetical protein